MELSLAPEVKRIIEDCVNSGAFSSGEDVVATAVYRLRDQDDSGDFAPGEMDQLIAEGENSGPPIPYEMMRRELKGLRNSHGVGKP